ncbi:Uncharacterised protein [uncultured archaeon]|nr:Uncharacterised protein [uncultured archaeon]
MYEIIGTFSPIFRGLNCENPRAAAIYYVNLIINFPTNLQHILNEAQEIYKNEINRQSLQFGRQELLDKGLIARAYFTEDADIDFDREPFLPVSPEIIWGENLDKVKAYWSQPEDIAFRNRKMRDLHEYYLKKFKKYGLGTESGSITSLYNSVWITHTLINNIKYNKRLDLMLGSLGSFDTPNIEYYKKMLIKGMTVRVLYDPNMNDQIRKSLSLFEDEESLSNGQKAIIEQRIKNIKNLQKDYSGRIELRYTAVTNVTSRRMICYDESGPYLAIDARKILSLDSGGSSNYIGTIYLQQELIKYICENFEAAWSHSVKPEESFGEITLEKI